MTAPLYSKTVFYDSGMSSYWDTVTFETGTTKNAVDPGNFHGSMVSVQFSRSEAAGVREDLAQFDLHLAVAAGLGLYASLDATDAATVETALDTMWTTMKVNHSAHISLANYVWRDYGMDYPLGKTGFSKPGPVWRTTARSVAGSGAQPSLPDQVAETVTFKTPSRRHWGRIYLPNGLAANTTNEARIISGAVDIWCGAVHTFVNDLNDNARQIDTFVWSPKYRGALGIESIQMDNTYDVIRRRRAKQTTYRKVFTS